MKEILFGDLFTAEDIKTGISLLNQNTGSGISDARLIKEKLIDNIIDRINEVTGQENDPMYFAYMFIHHIGQVIKAN